MPQINSQLAKKLTALSLFLRFVGYPHNFDLIIEPIESVFMIQVSELLQDL